ncbi:MAG TPA: sigma-70 family RNA polymerase sigma factor [Chloroflexota bacterium]|jgi:RNA polymerase sigma-70 factor (ECF subfamily)|nr:sigma-70 family RNA polymerase sigma factor [Chloroflexota bacterium]
MSTDRPVSTVAYAEDLVRRVRENDPQAFDELYSRYSTRVFGYLFQRLNGNAEEAEDLTADVFTRVYEKIDAFQPQGAPLSAWVFRIAHNKLIDSVRRKPKQTQITLDDAPEISAGPVFGWLDQQLAMDQIKAGLARLTYEQRQVITLRFLEGKSLAETAVLVGRNEDAVKKLQARGLASLRRGIECLSGCWKVDLEHAS